MMTQQQTSKVQCIDADAKGAIVLAHDADHIDQPGRQRIEWQTLREAAEQRDAELASIYSQILKDARRRLRRKPIAEQDIRIVLHDQGTNVMFVAAVYDVSGDYRRDLMLAHEGMQQPRTHLARSEAADIAKRIPSARIVDNL